MFGKTLTEILKDTNYKDAPYEFLLAAEMARIFYDGGESDVRELFEAYVDWVKRNYKDETDIDKDVFLNMDDASRIADYFKRIGNPSHVKFLVMYSDAEPMGDIRKFLWKSLGYYKERLELN